MRNYLLALIGFTILFYTSCIKNESKGNWPSIPDSVELDINEDGISDYKFQYVVPIIDSQHNLSGIVGTIYSFRKNEILQNSEKGILFLRNLENIELNVNQPFKWERSISSTAILSITANINGEWPSQWEVKTDKEQPSYFLGLKMINDNNVQLAWLEFVINKNDGNISIINKGIL